MRVVEDPLLCPIASLEQSNEIFSILTSVGIEILNRACEYYRKTSIICRFVGAVETPFKCRCRAGSEESEGEELVTITRGQISLQDCCENS